MRSFHRRAERQKKSALKRKLASSDHPFDRQFVNAKTPREQMLVASSLARMLIESGMMARVGLNLEDFDKMTDIVTRGFNPVEPME